MRIYIDILNCVYRICRMISMIHIAALHARAPVACHGVQYETAACRAYGRVLSECTGCVYRVWTLAVIGCVSSPSMLVTTEMCSDAPWPDLQKAVRPPP